ncbi:MAG: DUF4440 domain-containing protein [Acidobacteriota bacterium]
MKPTLASTFVLFVTLALVTPGSALAWHDTESNLDRVADASAEFVETFNLADADGLGGFYAQAATLKLPNALALSGREAIVAAWLGGFDAGLDQLILNVDVLEPLGARRVLESGSYELTIRTPGGEIVQTGTYAVLWRVPSNPHRAPRILFDTIDAD